MKWYHWLGLGVVGWLVWKGSSKASAVEGTIAAPLHQPPSLNQLEETIYGGVVGIQKVLSIYYTDNGGQKWVPVFSISASAVATGKASYQHTVEQVETTLKAKGVPFDTFRDVSTKQGVNSVMVFVREPDEAAARAAIQQIP